MGVITDHPELALFLCLPLGYLIGKLRVGPITLGGIAGTLIVALLIGAWTKAEVSDDVKTVFFAIFIFALGYLAGPQFFANLNRKGMRFGVLCLIDFVCVIGLALGIAKAFDLDVGTASGILAGAATESAVVGTATESIGNLPGLSADQVKEYQGNGATAYTVCYLFGLITTVLYTSQFMPMMMRINLRDASRELWETMRGGKGALESDELPGLTGFVGRRAEIIAAGRHLGPETAGIPGLDAPLATKQVSVTEKGTDGLTIDEMIANLPQAEKDRLDRRYGTLTLEPEKIRFIDRLVADSRQVALNHTAGLSLPQQVMMTLFSLFDLLEEGQAYKLKVRAIVRQRLDLLLEGAQMKIADDPQRAGYYVELDLLAEAERVHGPDFAAFLRKNYEPVDSLFRLAEQTRVVLLNGGGFDGPEWSARVSPANLDDLDYLKIGHHLRKIFDDYAAEWKASQARHLERRRGRLTSRGARC